MTIILISELSTFGRKKKQNYVAKGALAGGVAGSGIGVLNSLAVSALKKKMGIRGIRPSNPLNNALRSGVMEGAKGAAGGAIIGGIVYKNKKNKK